MAVEGFNNFESKAMIAPIFKLGAEDIEAFYVIAVTKGFNPETGPDFTTGEEIKVLTATNIHDFLVRQLFYNLYNNNMLRGYTDEPIPVVELIREYLQNTPIDNVTAGGIDSMIEALYGKMDDEDNPES